MLRAKGSNWRKFESRARNCVPAEASQSRSLRWRPGPAPDLPRSTRKESASKLRPLRLRLAVIAPVTGPFEEPSSGNWPAPDGASHMSHNLSLPQSHAFQLSRDLMVPVTLFSVNGEYGVLPSDE